MGLGFSLLLTLTLLIHYYHASMLTIIDDGWTCTIAPVMKNILTPLLQVARLFYALFITIMNAFIVLHGQLFKAWYITAAKCNSRMLLNAVGESALVVKTFSNSTAGFFGYASTNENSGGNFMTNNFEFAEPIYHGLRALSGMEDVAICACARFELIFNLLFTLMFRLYFTFQETIYAFNKRIFRILKFAMSILTVTAVIVIITHILLLMDILSIQMAYIHTYTLILFDVMYTVLAIFFVAAFVYKLYRFVSVHTKLYNRICT